MPKGMPKNGFRMTKKRKAMLASGKNPLAVFNVNAQPTVVETEEQIRSKLKDTFDSMEVITHDAIDGDCRAAVISGPAGLGKSFTVHRILQERNPYHGVISGFVRPTGLYKTLYEFREKGSVVVLDDADSVFMDENALNILKKACDTTKKREISWLAETRMEDEGGDKLPRSFEFEGSIIFITNKDFDAMIEQGNKLAPHFEAMVSRSYYLDLAMKNRKDYMVRIKMVIEQGMLKDYGMSKKDEQEIISYIEKHMDEMRELSLRIVVKIAGLKRKHPDSWERLAKVFCCKKKVA